MFLLIDKPLGVSSFFVVKKLRKILNTKKVGYLGTLDPLASGCLLVASHGSTKLIHMLEKSEKTYFCTIDISGRSESYDLGTPVVETDMKDVCYRSPEEVRTFLLSQTHQVPPRYSAIHLNGVRAYELARKNEDFHLPSRPVSIPFVEVVDISLPIITLRIRISAGGYIRSLAPLVGNFFGVDGGYITLLRREMLHLPGCDLSVTDGWKLDSILPLSPISYTTIFPHIPTEEVSHHVYMDLLSGKDASLANESEYKNGQNIFMRYGDIFTSLVRKNEDVFVIERNGV